MNSTQLNMNDLPKRKSVFEKFITGVEVVGNKLPNPFWMFVWLILIVMAVSVVMSEMGASVTYLKASKVATEAPTATTVAAKNLLSKDAMRIFFQNFVTGYSGFAPLGLVIVMMLGISLMEQSGMLVALMRATILGAPPFLVTVIIAFVGICSNIASNAAVVIVPAIAGAIFKSLGRNPWVGIIVGYAAANGGFTANIFIAGTDVLMAGITQSVTVSMGINAPVHPLFNWYYMIAATVALTIATALVEYFFTRKQFENGMLAADSVDLAEHYLKDNERKGLRWSGVAAVLFIIIVLIFTVPQGSIFRNNAGTFLPDSPLLSSIVALLFFFFVVVGITYGRVSGTIKSWDDVPKFMEEGVKGILGFIVIALPAAIFIDLFSYSNIAVIIGVKGGELLASIQLNGFLLLLAFIIMCLFTNFFLSSGSAKWLILAPIFVPMFSAFGLSPAATVVAYRIADSCADIISPIAFYLPVIIGLFEKYEINSDHKVGIGTVVAQCIPYTLAYLASMLLLLLIWYLFKLPLGPGVPFFM